MNRMYSTHELLEIAQLDVLGLLDAEEREAFERSFRAASPDVQAQIRREQTRLAGAGADSLLPRVEAPLGLRARVLAAIRDAMQTMASRKDELVGEVAGRVGPRGVELPRFAAPLGVNRWWRAGAIGAIAASIVFGFTTLQMRSDNKQLAKAQENNMMTELFLKEYGPRFEKMFLSPSTKFVQFTPASGNTSSREAKAVLALDSTTRKGQLFLKNFSGAVSKYSLVVVDEQGNQTHAVLEFQATGNGVDHRDIESLDLEGAGSLAIIESSAGTQGAPTVLTSSKL